MEAFKKNCKSINLLSLFMTSLSSWHSLEKLKKLLHTLNILLGVLMTNVMFLVLKNQVTGLNLHA